MRLDSPPPSLIDSSTRESDVGVVSCATGDVLWRASLGGLFTSNRPKLVVSGGHIRYAGECGTRVRVLHVFVCGVVCGVCLSVCLRARACALVFVCC